jgi:riboflavin-specific deaminase-like protein
VTIKFAQTLDGRIATYSGHSRWISSIEARQRAHRLRAEHDGILVGVGTILADDPQLTVRLGEGRNPVRIVVDSRLRTPLTAHVLTLNPENTVMCVTASASADRQAAVEAAGATVLRLPELHGRVDLAAALVELSGRGIRSVLVEGGAQIFTSLLRGRLADRCVVFIAPKIVGKGVESIGDLEVSSMDAAIWLEDVAEERVGVDIALSGRLVYPTE